MLQVPLEIAFHNVEGKDWAEEEIRGHVADLERIYDRIISCRIHIDQRTTNENGTIPPVVHIELGIRGRKNIVVSHEPGHLQRKFQRPDLHNAINEAFRIAGRRLHDLKEKREGRSKDASHDSENQALGGVADVDPTAGR
jgi:ribosome-associated translation inhibitor RaiA